MAANGGGPPFVKKEEEFDSNCNSNSITNNHHYLEKNDYRGISIAERRAAKCGFNASNVNAALSPPPYFTVPPGISPSALLDSPIMLPNEEAQLSPTTGTMYPSPNHESLKLKLKITSASNGTETCSSENNLMADHNNYKVRTQEFEYPNECFESSGNEMLLDHGKAPPPANHHHKNAAAAASVPKLEVSKNSEDGFYWRKYGQKHVKGSEYPRSYYKCTNTNCPVTKKVERSHDGHIAEIVYKGNHNHPQPHPPKQMMGELCTGDHAVPDGTSTISSNFHNDFPDPEAEDVSPESVSLHEEVDAESEAAKKRKRESETAAVPRSTAREPKVVVQLESEVDILEDGYRWRKYGQKVVKGNPNPRSYYKCTTPNCPVRKHVERAANDIKSVMTTYEGKHTHLVPSSKSSINSSDVNAFNPVASTKSAGKQHLPLYLDRKPIFNYTSLAGSGEDFNFGASSPYQLPFPPFHSMPNYVPIKTYSKLYPDYMPMPMSVPMPMPMPMPMPIPSSSTSSHVSPFPYGADAHTSSRVEPKEEQDDQLYDTCMTIPHPPNPT